MKEKRALWLTIISLILVFAFVACSSNDKKDEKEDKAKETAAATVAATDAASPTLANHLEVPTIAFQEIPTYSLPETPTFASLEIPTFQISTYEYHAPTIHFEFETIAPFNIDLYAGLDLGDMEGDVKTDERGALSLDSKVLFSYDSAELSETGKKDLKTFIDQYAKVVTSEKNKDKITKITVEGHTDDQGSYDYNKKLSEKRATNVLNYCIKLHPELKPYMVAKGCSYDYPVKKADGSIDREASRRVCFVAE